jgi:hypothetical protein
MAECKRQQRLASEIGAPQKRFATSCAIEEAEVVASNIVKLIANDIKSALERLEKSACGIEATFAPVLSGSTAPEAAPHTSKPAECVLQGELNEVRERIETVSMALESTLRRCML